MRSPAVVFLLIGLFFGNATRAQSNALIVQGQTGKLYLQHTVVAKETWYGIGRLYNTGPKAVAAFNTLSMDKPLPIGQEIEIPLTATNFSQTGQKTAGETLLPVYHIVQEKEWMYRISVNHNKVPIGSLEKWNHITKDQVKAGMYLVVGFLQVKTALSAFAKEPPPSPATSTTPDNSVSEVIPNGKSDTTPMTMRQPAAKKAVPSTGEITKMEVTTKDAPKPVTKPTAASVIKEETKTGSLTKTAPTAKDAEPVAKEATKTFNGGYFRTDYTDGGKMASGLAGTFKSSSGWQDGKYYALMNNVAVGTIVKIRLSSTNKSVYAKILGSLPDMKESVGLTIRLSNAAVAELGGSDARFNVEVHY